MFILLREREKKSYVRKFQPFYSKKNLNSFLYYENIQINLEFKTLDSRGMYYIMQCY